MTELVRLVMDLVHSFSPFRIVWQHERGLLFIGGRYVWTLRPGLKVFVPYLMDVKCVSVVPEIYQTKMQSITLRDGRALTFLASLTVYVEEPWKAWNLVGHWSETVIEDAAGILSEGLADADPQRFDPARGKRDRLRHDLCQSIDEVTSKYGVRVTEVRFNDFVIGIRTIRLIGGTQLGG